MAAPERDTIGRYERLFELGRGGMAVLHLACLRSVGGFTRLFAIKQILPHLAADSVFVEMFLAESRTAARLSHPNLCAVFELGHHRGELFLVMEYLDGVPWDALAAALPPDDADRRLALTAGVLAQACDGLHHAHTFRDVDGTALPIVHRDVSPQNLIVSADGVCRVLDFGVSKIATDHRRTRTGVRKGKLPYMAPEQIRGEPVDARADVWAIGVMLWEALAGRPLFDRDSDFLIYQAITGADIPPVGARYPASADRVIARALARDRDQRHATAHELGHDLADLGLDVGGAASREAIAAALTARCGDRLAARRQAIAAALARLPAAADDRDAVTQAGEPGEPCDPARDAAETASMAMRKDAIVVDRPRRSRWWIGGLALAAVAGSVAVVAALGGRAASPEPSATASGGDRPVAPAPAGPPSAPGAASASGHGPPGAAGAAAAANGGRGSASAAANRDAHGAPGAASAAGDRGGPPDAAAGNGDVHGAGGAAANEDVHGAAGAAPPPVAAASAPRAGASHTPSHASNTRPGAHPDAHPGAAATAPRPRDRAAHAAGSASAAPPAPPISGWYAIDSAPYATIYIDDRKIGDTPLDRIPLSAGSHRVRAVLADGRQRSFAIDVAPDHKTSEGTLRW